MTTNAWLQNKGGASGDSASPLFTRLPAEIRLMIYRETFAGSTTNLRLLPSSEDNGRSNTRDIPRQRYIE